MKHLIIFITKKLKGRIIIISAACAAVVLLVFTSLAICRSIQSRWLVKQAVVPAAAVPESSAPSSFSPPASSGKTGPGATEQSAASVQDSGNKGTIYMTFDDGPSDLTEPLLDILDRYHVKATFFVVGKDDAQGIQEMKDIVERGHAIGVHSYTHNYQKIYASSSAFFLDFDKMHSLILQATGVDTKICRFAGGSVNAYDRRTRKSIIKELVGDGYVYYDWNVSSGDSATKTNSDIIFHNAINGVHQHKTSVVLFHNSKYKNDTLAQVPRFIETLQGEGYCFRKLDPPIDNRPFIFG